MSMGDLGISLALLGALALAAVAYWIRVVTKGSPRSERIERGGSSVFLGRDAQEMGYLTLQPLARACLRLGISANAITLSSLVLGALAGVAVAMGRPGLCALFSTMAALCDGLDGLVARASGTASDAGETFDAAVDRYVELFFFAGLIYYFRWSPLALGFVITALIGSFMVSYATAKAEALHVDAPRGSMRRVERAVYLTLGVGLVPLAAHFAPHAARPVWLSNLPLLVALGVVGIVANASAVRRFVHIARQVAGAAHPPASIPHNTELEAPAQEVDAERSLVR
jgi:CDP-diacylglycerol--glycerol-3-phosphate 3-phosphatidyltransferase